MAIRDVFAWTHYCSRLDGGPGCDVDSAELLALPWVFRLHWVVAAAGSQV